MKVAPLEAIIFVSGLVAATASGLWAWDRYGMYGDGPRGPGYSREWDETSRTYRLVHETRTRDGLVRRAFDDRGNVVEISVDRDADGNADESLRIDANGRAGFGFSRAGDGIIDAWRFTDTNGQTVRIEISTRQDGRIDRWEHYADNMLTRVEVDKDGDGRPD